MTSGDPGWQRLSPWAVVILFVGGLLRLLRENLPLLLGAGAGLAFVERIGLAEVLTLAALLALLVAVISLLYYRRFRFRLEGDVLLVQRGLLERRELKLTAGQIQHMGISQPLFMRPFDVVRFSLDTPGGGTTQVELPGIRREVAEALRQAMLRAREHQPETVATAPAAPPPPVAALLYRIDAAGLTLHGLASNYAYVVAAGLAPLLQPLTRALRQQLEQADGLGWLRGPLEQPLTAAALLIGGLVLLLVGVSVVVSWLRFYGFTLTRERDRLVQHSGLVNRQEQALSLTRLQSVEWVQTALGRLLGRGHLICRQYGGTPQAADGAGGSFLIPGLRPAAALRLARVLWPRLRPRRRWQRVHPYYRRLLLVRLGPPLLLASALLAAVGAAPGWPAVTLLALALLWPMGYLRWRALGWQRQGRYLLIRHGLLGRRTHIFPLTSVQALTLQQSWFQRRRGVLTLQLTLASGSVSLPYLPEASARALADEALYRLERAATEAPPSRSAQSPQPSRSSTNA